MFKMHSIGIGIMIKKVCPVLVSVTLNFIMM